MKLCLLLTALPLSNGFGHITRTCRVNDEVESIYVEEHADSSRFLRGRPGGYTKAFIKIANHEEEYTQERALGMRGQWSSQRSNSTTPSVVPFDGLHCECTTRLATRDSFYCPVTSNSCEVWTGFKSKDDYAVSCTNENWMVAYARYMWYYLVFWFAFLALSLLLTAPGQHAIKYVISRRFPGINHRIVDLIVELEGNRQMQTQINIAYERHAQRRRDGWVTGYKLKTRRYCGADEKAGDKSDGDMAINTDASEPDAAENDGSLVKSEEKDHVSDDEINDSNVDTSLEKSGEEVNEQTQDACSRGSGEHDTCTICLLDIEEGDIIADVKCGHHYHADCLKEWILKKNSCPLCQASDVAEEVREFASDDDFNHSLGRDASADQDTMLGRFRRRAQLTVIGHGYSVFEIETRHYSNDQRRFFAPF